MPSTTRSLNGVAARAPARYDPQSSEDGAGEDEDDFDAGRTSTFVAHKDATSSTGGAISLLLAVGGRNRQLLRAYPEGSERFPEGGISQALGEPGGAALFSHQLYHKTACSEGHEEFEAQGRIQIEVCIPKEGARL